GVLVVCSGLAACSSSSRSVDHQPSIPSTSVARSTPTTRVVRRGATRPGRREASSTTTVPGASALKRGCGNRGPAPKRYPSIVVCAFENRTWNDVGLGFGPAMPYLHELGRQCSYFTDWTETDTAQSSLTQYVGQVTGARQPGTNNDCSPSPSCSTTADNF